MHCVQNIFDADLISSDIGGNNVMGIDDVTDERSSNGFCGSVIRFQYAFVQLAHSSCIRYVMPTSANYEPFECLTDGEVTWSVVSRAARTYALARALIHAE